MFTEKLVDYAIKKVQYRFTRGTIGTVCEAFLKMNLPPEARPKETIIHIEVIPLEQNQEQAEKIALERTQKAVQDKFNKMHKLFELPLTQGSCDFIRPHSRFNESGVILSSLIGLD